jgi:hypothetical protein
MNDLIQNWGNISPGHWRAIVHVGQMGFSSGLSGRPAAARGRIEGGEGGGRGRIGPRGWKEDASSHGSSNASLMLLQDLLLRKRRYQGDAVVPESRGAIHQLLTIILKLRILVLLPVSTMPYVDIVKNYS